ncbi:MAG: UvrD-helicase domain-containing protein, partial [Bacteroidota bacterium]
MGKFNPSNKKFETIEIIQLNKSATDVSSINLVLPKIVDLLKEAYYNFERIAFYKAFLKNVTPLSLLNTISAELTNIQKEQNLLSIAEFNTLIHHHIQNQPALFIYERIGEKYHHFFIDEFQDTSQLQWQNLIPLIDNALSSEFGAGNKGTLIIVGDPKQSIYRWRGGKAEQFIELSKCKNPFQNPDKKLFQLDTNFRSYSNVIDFNNAFFSFLSGEFEDLDYKDLYKNHSHQLSTNKKGGCVSITLINEKADADSDVLDEEEEDRNAKYCKYTLSTIKETLQQGFGYKEIAILTRKKIQGIEIAHYLSEYNIPIISSETLLVQNSPNVKFIVSVLEYLNNQDNRESKADLLYFLSNKSQINIQTHDFIA